MDLGSISDLSAWRQGLGAIWERDRDPFLNELRWRLHLRLILISAALTAGMLAHDLTTGGSADLSIGIAASLVGWAYLRRNPAHNRWVVRAVLVVFCSLGTHRLWHNGPEKFPTELLALMIMPVFATLLDGIATGAIVVAILLFAGGSWLAHNGRVNSDDTLSAVFCLLAGLSFYLCCVAHTWMFTSLVEQRRRATEAAQATRNAVERLAATLSDQVFGLTKRLQADIQAQGLHGLEAARQLNATLKKARLDRPAEIPQNVVNPQALLQDLRRAALRVFLSVAFSLSTLSLVIMLVIHQTLWQLAAGMSLFCAALIVGSGRDPRWRWRLRAFLAGSLVALSIDVHYSIPNPPAASLVFAPLIVFFAAMLDEFSASLVTGAGALAVLGASYWLSAPNANFMATLSTEALLLPTIIAISAATLPMYRALLEQLNVEEDQLSLGLASYRRLMSTFFHDLANPLAVLQALASLPVALQSPDDKLRALRMAERMDAVAQAARQALLGSAPTQSRTTLGQLSDELYDLFKERLREKELVWVLSSGADVTLHQSGPLLRDSVLGNLLSNAVKFSPPGASLELKGWQDEEGAHVQLSDTGRGIPPQVLADLAQGRSPQSLNGTEGEVGSGFGLLLAKTYMVELGGKLELRARKNGGTEAELVLPQG